MINKSTATLGQISANNAYSGRPIRSTGQRKMGNEAQHGRPRKKGMHDIDHVVRIMQQPQDGEDVGRQKHQEGDNYSIRQKPRAQTSRRGEWLVPTGKGGTVRMGWKTL